MSTMATLPLVPASLILGLRECTTQARSPPPWDRLPRHRSRQRADSPTHGTPGSTRHRPGAGRGCRMADPAWRSRAEPPPSCRMLRTSAYGDGQGRTVHLGLVLGKHPIVIAVQVIEEP